MNPRFISPQAVPHWARSLQSDPVTPAVDLLHLWGVRQLALAPVHPVSLIVGGPEDGLQSLGEKLMRSPEEGTLVLTRFYDMDSTFTQAINQEDLRLFLGPHRKPSGSDRLLDQILARRVSKLIIRNLELVRDPEMQKLAAVRDKMMSIPSRPFAVLALGVGDKDLLEAKLCKLRCRVATEQAENLSRQEIKNLVAVLGSTLDGQTAAVSPVPNKQMLMPGFTGPTDDEQGKTKVLTAVELIELYSRRAGSIERVINRYQEIHGYDVKPYELLQILLGMDSHFVASLNALQGGNKNKGKNGPVKIKKHGKRRRSSRKTPAR
jgi:hypothetical protein